MRATVVPVPSSEDTDPGWREELSKRVETFRRRRARLHPSEDSAGNLQMEFENVGEADDPFLLDEAATGNERSGHGFDLDLGDYDEARLETGKNLETIPFQKASEDGMQFEPAPAPGEDMSWEVSAPEGRPMEIVVGLPDEPLMGSEQEAETITLAPVGHRFLAGLTDALVLVLSAVVFGGIFWRSGGHMSPNPINLGVAGAIVIILIFSYFGLFTALTSTTPGLLWMGYEIRNLHGDRPTLRESCWRAFGVLVSLSALMLGFIWAWVDSESLTWHDRMSGTFISVAPSGHGTPHTERDI